MFLYLYILVYIYIEKLGFESGMIGKKTQNNEHPNTSNLRNHNLCCRSKMYGL